MVATDEEKDLVIRSRNGDREAFELLVRTYQRMIHALCYRMTGSLDEAEDLVQETFLQAYQHLEGFRAESRFSSWLYRIATNHCLNWRSRQARRRRAYEQWEPPQSVPAKHQLSELVQESLMKLPAKQRAALVLTVYQGMNHAEAARALRCSEATTSWRVFAARRKLKRWLTPCLKSHE